MIVFGNLNFIRPSLKAARNQREAGYKESSACCLLHAGFLLSMRFVPAKPRLTFNTHSVISQKRIFWSHCWESPKFPFRSESCLWAHSSFRPYILILFTGLIFQEMNLIHILFNIFNRNLFLCSNYGGLDLNAFLMFFSSERVYITTLDSSVHIVTRWWAGSLSN